MLQILSACLLGAWMIAGSIQTATAELLPGERRAQVIEAIASGSSGLGVLQRGLHDEDLRVRITAARGLVQLGEPAADLLAEAMRDSSPEIRQAVFGELIRLNQKPPHTLFAMLLDDPSEQVQRQAGDVIARMWDMLPDAGEDLSQFRLDIGQYTTFIKAGPCNAAMEITVDGDPRHARRGALLGSHRAFVPRGAFTIEVAFRPKPALAEQSMAYLVDMMGVTGQSEGHRANFRITLHRQAEMRQHIAVNLGFGHEQDLATYRTEPVELNPQQWYYLVFVYDGQGTGRIYLNGELQAQRTYEGKTDVLFGDRDYNRLSLGERSTSYFHAFPGQIGLFRVHQQAVVPSADAGKK